MEPSPPRGLQFVTAAASLAVALAQGTLQEPEVRARVWERYAQRSRTLWQGAGWEQGRDSARRRHNTITIGGKVAGYHGQ